MASNFNNCYCLHVLCTCIWLTTTCSVPIKLLGWMIFRDSQLTCSSLVKPSSPTPSFLPLSLVICWVERWGLMSFSPIHFSMSVGFILVRFMLGRSCCWDFMGVASDITRRLGLTANSSFLWLLTVFPPLLPQCHRVLGAEVFCSCFLSSIYLFCVDFKEIFLILTQNSALLWWFRYELSRKFMGWRLGPQLVGPLGGGRLWSLPGWRKLVLRRECLKNYCTVFLLFLPSNCQEMSSLACPSFLSTVFRLTLDPATAQWNEQELKFQKLWAQILPSSFKLTFSGILSQCWKLNIH